MTKDNKLLVVEDDPAHLALLTLELEEAGFFVEGAKSGEEAKGRLICSPVSIVITDLIMGDVSGIDLLKFIKNQNLKTEVIVISGKGSIELAVEAMQHGAFDFLIKPIAKGRLEKGVQRCFEKIASEAKGVKSAFESQEIESELEGFGLTKSEARVVNLIAKGDSDHRIAEKLFISYHTVRRHIQSIFKKMKVNNRIDLIIQFK